MGRPARSRTEHILITLALTAAGCAPGALPTEVGPSSDRSGLARGGAATDSDGDGIDDVDELRFGTDPGDPDTDGDSVPDGAEVWTFGTDPRVDEGRCFAWQGEPLGTAMHRGDDAVAGDYDGDGDDDIVVLGSLRRANGDGLFLFENRDGATPPVPVQVASMSESPFYASLLFEDLDADGVRDLIFPQADELVVWRRNLGGGSYAPSRHLLPTLEDVGAIALIDVTGDGLLDLVSTPGGWRWAWFENLGAGNLGPEVPFHYNDSARASTVGDLDGDGRDDLVVASHTSIQIALNHGAGLSAPLEFRADGRLLDVELADADLDGDLDVFAVTDEELLMWRNDGYPALVEQTLLSGVDLSQVEVGDLEGDGDPDLFVGAKEVWVVESLDGGGTWKAKQVSPWDLHGVESLLGYDPDRDGDTDLGVWRWDLSHQLENPSGDDGDVDGLTAETERCVTGTDPLVADTDAGGTSDLEELWALTDPRAPLDDLPLVDLDGDLLSDRVELHVYHTDPGAADTDVDGLDDGEEVLRLGTDPLLADTDREGLSDGGEVDTHGTDPVLVDTDGDGLSDADEVLVHGTDPLLVDSDGDRLSDPDELAFGTDPHGPDPDGDGDGLPDLAEQALGTDPVLADSDGDQLDDGDEHALGTDPLAPDSDLDGVQDGFEVQVLGTDPSFDERGCEVWPQHFGPPPTDELLAVAPGDVDGDGDLDVVAALGFPVTAAVWYENLGAGVYSPTWNPVGAASGSEDLTVADLDADGDLDVLVSATKGLTTFVNTGSGVFGPVLAIGTSRGEVDASVVTDLNGDGRLDVVAVFDENAALVVFENLPGGFGPGQVVDTCRGPDERSWCDEDRWWSSLDHDLSQGDVDGDGDPDVILADEEHDRILLYRNDAGVLRRDHPVAPVTIAPDGTALADLDQDGDLDLLSSSYHMMRAAWFENLGGGQFAPERLVSEGCSGGIDTADFDGDGDLDPVVGCASLLWFENHGGGAFSAGRLVADIGEIRNQFLPPRVGDFDGDGDTDVLAHMNDMWGDFFSWQENRGFEDLDLDGLGRELEVCVVGTDPSDADTDGDGQSDGAEVAGGTDPR